MNFGSVARSCLPFLALLFAASGSFAQADATSQNIVSRTANVEGVQFHYMTAGKGPAVVLIHGYAETSTMWKLLIPLLAQHGCLSFQFFMPPQIHLLLAWPMTKILVLVYGLT